MTPDASQNRIACWVVSDGRAGIEAQALGLAEAVSRIVPLAIERKVIAVAAPWRNLPRTLWGDPFSRLENVEALNAPYPELWIACGRLTAPFSMAMKARRASTFIVQLQDPRAPLTSFDLVIPPAHDALAGDNVFPIIGSPNRINREKLASICADENNVALLIGGPNRAFAFTRKDAERLGEMVAALAARGLNISATTSRRTPPEVVEIFRGILGAAAVNFYVAGTDDPGANPYPSMLGEAASVIVTEDSVNMAGEAASLGKPVFVFPLTRKLFAGAGKFDAFHQSLRERGAARVFNGEIEYWSFEPLDETARAAAEIVRRWRS